MRRFAYHFEESGIEPIWFGHIENCCLQAILRPRYRCAKAGVMLLDLQPADLVQQELALEDDVAEPGGGPRHWNPLIGVELFYLGSSVGVVRHSDQSVHPDLDLHPSERVSYTNKAARHRH